MALNVLKNKLGEILNPIIPRYSYKVGDLFITTNDDNPATRFGGTWRKLTDDAYLKIVTENAGETKGTSKDHKIPIASMPTHSYTNAGGSYSNTNITGGSGIVPQTNPYSTNTGPSGGGQAYYPWYLGVYVWIKEAN